MEYKQHANVDVSYEPFRAAYTGTLTTFKAQDGKWYSLQKPFARVAKGQPFMLAINRKTQTCRLVPVVPPDSRMHS